MKSTQASLISFKLFIALLGFSAIVTEIATLKERDVFQPFNFFSFFTIEMNILVVITFLLSAVLLAAKKQQQLDQLRAATTVYILIVGIGFAALLSGLQNAQFTAVPWDNVVLHYLIPLLVITDFVIDPPKKALRFRTSLLWLLFPLGYLLYTLVRGPIVGWYPYPFLNPTLNGYEGIVLPIIGMLALALTLTYAVCKLSGRKPLLQ